MLDLLYSRFDFSAPNQSGQVLAAAIAVWVVVVACTVLSIRARGFDARLRTMLIALVVCVPLFGVLAYLPLALRRESIPFIPLLRAKSFRG